MPKDENFWLGVDLDGTIAEHYWPHKGRYEETRIGDPIKPMVERVKSWLREGKTVKIFTARVSDRRGRDIMPIRAAIQSWCRTHIGMVLEVTCEKNYRMTQLWDDRAVGVIQNTGEPCCANHSRIK
jgi:hypothetical protein